MEKKSKFEMAVVERVKEVRISLQKSQAYVAMVLDVSEGYIGQVESPKYASRYTLDQLNKLAKEFGCSPQRFIPEHPIDE